MGGKPCIRGMRVTVGTIVGMLAEGHSSAEILSYILTWNRKTFLRLFLMQLSARKSAKSI